MCGFEGIWYKKRANKVLCTLLALFIWFTRQSWRTQKDTYSISVTLVAAGWMFASLFTSNLCSEATNMEYVLFQGNIPIDCWDSHVLEWFFSQDSSNVLYISWFFFDRKTLYVRKDFSSFTDAIDFHSSIFRKKKLNISI